MRFARAISNRVFYMDEGCIYEDGSPEQVFESPKREKTRRFVQRLKVLELNIESRDYDFLGMASQIEAYCNKNQIPPRLANHVQLTFEEAVQQLIGVVKEPRIQAVCEYSEATEAAEWRIRYGGAQLDVTQAGDEVSLRVLKGMTEGMLYDWTEDEALPNRLCMRVKSN